MQSKEMRTVIAVDDDLDSLELIYEALSIGGFECLTVSDPEDALEQITWFPPAAIIVDMVMPKMSGIDFCLKVSDHFGGEAPPIIVLSGTDNERAITRAFEAGAKDYILKPFRIGLLNAKLKAALGDLHMPGTNAPPTQAPRRIGKYKIVKELGRGGMGVVYEALHPHFRKPVALKTIWASNQVEIGDVLRFRREIDLLLSFDHPNLVKVLDAGRSKNTFYYAMDCFEGHSLDHKLDFHGAFPFKEVLRVSYALADAIHYIHGHKLLHRDIKPANILFTADGQPVLSDFGLSKSLIDNQLTDTKTVVGTPHFMAPELIRGEAYDHRIDLFALGMVLIEMLTGKVLIGDDNAYQVMSRIAMADYPMPSELFAHEPYPSRFVAALDKLIAHKAQDRFEDIHDFIVVLEQLLRARNKAAAPEARVVKAPARVLRDGRARFA